MYNGFSAIDPFLLALRGQDAIPQLPETPFIAEALSAPAGGPQLPNPQTHALISVLGGQPFNQPPLQPAAPDSELSWGAMTPQEARQEVQESLPALKEDVELKRQHLEQAKEAEAPVMLWGMPVYEEYSRTRPQERLQEAEQREQKAERQLAGEAPLPTKTPERSYAETFAQSAVKSLSDIPRFVGYIGGWLGYEAGSGVEPTSNAVYRLGQQTHDWAKETFPADPERQEEFGTKAANLTGFLATLYGAGGIKAMAKGGPALAEKIGDAVTLGTQAALAASSGGMGQFEGATPAMGEGGVQNPMAGVLVDYGEPASVSERDRAMATLLGAGVGLTSLIPMASALATPMERSAGAVMAEALRGSGVNAGQMAAFNVLNNAIARHYYDPERPLTKGIGESMELGALAGGLTHGVMAARGARLSTPEEIKSFIDLARRKTETTDVGEEAGKYVGDERYWTGLLENANRKLQQLPPPEAPPQLPAPETFPALPKPAPPSKVAAPKEQPTAPEAAPPERLIDYKYEPMDVGQPTAGRVFYHGTKADIERVSDADIYGRSSVRNLYGEGLYLTDNPNVAKSYSEHKGRGGPGRVLAAKLNDLNLVDLEKPFPPQIFDQFRRQIESFYGPMSDTEAVALSQKPGKDVFSELKTAMSDEGLTHTEAADVYGEINDNLSEMGYDGLRHEGGGRFRKRDLGPHNVVILFEYDLWSPEKGQAGRPLKGKLQDIPYEEEPQKLSEAGPYAIRRPIGGEGYGAGPGRAEGEGGAAPERGSIPSGEGGQRVGGVPGQLGGAPEGLHRIIGTETFNYSDKHGTPIVGTVNREKPIPGARDRLVFRAYPEGSVVQRNKPPVASLGQPMALIKMNQHPNGEWEVGIMETLPEHEKRWLTKNMLDQVEARLGKLRAPGMFWGPGYQLWRERDPGSIEHHRRVGSEWLSPPYMNRLIEANNRQIAEMDPIADWDDIVRLKSENKELSAALESVPEEARTSEALEAPFAIRGLYNPALRAAEAAGQEKATPQQWTAALTKTPGVKRWLDLIGFDAWASGQKGPLKKQDVVEFIRANDVDIEEKVLAEPTEKETEEKINEVALREHGVPYSDLDFENQIWAMNTARNELKKSGISTKYGNYAIPNGDNYREILIRLPLIYKNIWKSPHFGDKEVVHLRVDDRRTESGRRVLHLNEAQSDLHQRGRKLGYSENLGPEEIEAKAKAKYDELFLEYENKKRIYDEKADKVIPLSDEYHSDLRDIKSNLINKGEIIRDLEYQGFTGNSIYSGIDFLVRRGETLPPDFIPMYRRMVEIIGEDRISKMQGLIDKMERLGEEAGWPPNEPDYEGIRGNIFAEQEEKSPDAPFKGDWWWEIGLKNLIRKAVEGGYDGISLPRSDQIEPAVNAEKGSLSVFYDQKIPKFLDKYVKKFGAKIEQERFSEANLSPSSISAAEVVNDVLDAAGQGLVPSLSREDTVILANAAGTRRYFYPEETITKLSPEGRDILKRLVEEKLSNKNPVVYFTPKLKEAVMGEGQALASAPERPHAAMEAALQAGETVSIPDDVIERAQRVVAPMNHVTPESVSLNVLSLVEPRPDGTLIATFRSQTGRPVAIAADSFRDLQDLRGLCLENGEDILIFDLGSGDIPEKAAKSGPGEVRADPLAGVALHESVHALYRRGLIPADDWSRLVGHAESLGVMETPVGEMLSAIGDRTPASGGQEFGLSLREAYALQYQSLNPKARDRLINEEEPVAHMMELFHHGHYSGEQMQSISDILEKMMSGSYANE